MNDIAPNVPAPRVPGSSMTLQDFFRAETRIRKWRARLPEPEAVQIIGRALQQLRDEEGWRMYKHASFVEYLAQDWHWTEAEAGAIIDMAVILAAENGVCSFPNTDSCRDCPGLDVCTYDRTRETTTTTTPANIDWPIISQADSIRRHGLLVAAVADLFDDVPPPETEEEVDEELRAAGYDPDEVGKRMAEVAALALEKVAAEARIVATTALIIDPEIQLRARGLDEDTVADYVVAMQNGAKFPPLVAFEDAEGALWLADGFHRLAALRWAEYDRAKVEVHSGDKRAASLYAATANATHGRVMSRAEKQEAGERLILLTEWSDRVIAQKLSVGKSSVNRWRQELSVPNGTDSPATRTVTRGDTTYEMDVSHIGQGASQTAVAPPTPPPTAWEPPGDFLLEGEAADQARRVAGQMYGPLASLEQCRQVTEMRRGLGAVDDETLIQAVREQHEQPGGQPLSEHPDYDGDEWNTPPELIAAARDVLGVIDLDPATNAAAQETIQAATSYTKEQNGLRQDWLGRVWLNPPYSDPSPFIGKLCMAYAHHYVSAALVLVNNATDTQWFHRLLRRFPACFIRGRVRFWQPGCEGNGPRQGQVVFYLGDDISRFQQVFGRFGTIVYTLDK